MSVNEGKRAEEASKNYYSGYYWGNEPYSSTELPGRKSDEDLRNDVIANLSKLGFSEVTVSVRNSVATLTGTVRTYNQRRNAGAEAWRTHGISQVLNELHVTEPETAGPSKS
jgi:osmotically-inducible protein OsmY